MFVGLLMLYVLPKGEENEASYYVPAKCVTYNKREMMIPSNF